MRIVHHKKHAVPYEKGIVGTNALVWYIFLLPVLMGILIFMVYPVLDSLRLSFFKSNGKIERFIGIQNYIWVLKTPLFWKSIGNTIYIAFFQILIYIPFSFLIASAINMIHLNKHKKNFLKALYFIPYITPVVASATMYLYVIHAQGLLNTAIQSIGLSPVSWLENPVSAKWGAILFGIWRSLGFSIIIFLANLQTISPEYYEAAQIDGCTRFDSWLHITIPNMKQTISFLIIMGWIGGMQRFSDVFILGNGIQGSPERSLYTIVSFIYDRGFGSYEFGLASAASYMLFLLILLFTFFNTRFSRIAI